MSLCHRMSLFWTLFIICYILSSVKASIASLEIVELEEWAGNSLPASFKKPFRLRPQYAIISHTDTDECFDEESCVTILKSLANHQSIFGKIKSVPAHFFVGGDERIYVGRGWDYIGEYDYDYRYKRATIDISLIGKFNDREPNAAQIRAAQKLLEYGILHDKLPGSYELLGQWEASYEFYRIPNLDSVIQKWPHWYNSATFCPTIF